MFEKLLSILIFTTILLVPLYVVRWNYFGILPTTLLETLILATITVWTVSKILRKDFSWPKTSFDKPILLFLLAAIISLFVTPDLRGGLGVLKSYIAEPILFFYVLVDTFSLRGGAIKSEALDRGSTKAILWALVLSGLWISILGIAQALFGIGVVTPHEAAAGRAHAVYNTGNALGLYVGPIFALGAGLLVLKLKSKNSSASWRIKTKSQILKLFNSFPFLIFSLCSFIFAIILSKSTGALVGLVVTIAIFFILFINQQLSINNHLKKLATIGFKTTLVITTTAGVLFFLNISRFTPKVDNPWERPSESTLTTRLCLWEGTKNLLFGSPIFGAGLSGFKELYSKKYFTCDAEPLEYPHNIFLNFWSEMGILGLVAFLWILMKFFSLLSKQMMFSNDQIPNLKSQTNSKFEIRNSKRLEFGAWCLVLGLAAAMVYWLIHGLVDVPYFKNDLALEFWVLIALVEILTQNQSLPYQNQQ